MTFKNPQSFRRAATVAAIKVDEGESLRKLTCFFFQLAGLLLIGCSSWWPRLEEQWVVIVSTIFKLVFFFLLRGVSSSSWPADTPHYLMCSEVQHPPALSQKRLQWSHSLQDIFLLEKCVASSVQQRVFETSITIYSALLSSNKRFFWQSTCCQFVVD